MAWQFYDSAGAIKRVTIGITSQLGGVNAEEFVQYDELERELSWKSDFDHSHDYLYGSSILSATQSSINTDASGSFSDLPGVSLTLSPGKWVISVNGNPRVWQSGTAYTNGLNQLRVVDSGVTTTYAATSLATVVVAEQAAPASLTLSFVLQVTAQVAIKAQGAHSIITGGANFAGGWRWDSGYGTPCTMYAVRVGA